MRRLRASRVILPEAPCPLPAYGVSSALAGLFIRFSSAVEGYLLGKTVLGKAQSAFVGRGLYPKFEEVPTVAGDRPGGMDSICTYQLLASSLVKMRAIDEVGIEATTTKVADARVDC
jgi:hypothetical protein